MNAATRPLSIDRADNQPSPDRWRGKTLRLLGAAVLHLAPLALLASALPMKPKALGGAFGQSVSVTLVSGAPARAMAPEVARPNLAQLEQRLSDRGAILAAPPSDPVVRPATRLSDLFGQETSAPGQPAAKGPPQATTGSGDDPFSRASVSYRGEDPAKAARLQAKAQRCARSARTLRLLVIINSEGYLTARPRALGTNTTNKSASNVIAAIERCAPFADAATPGMPRSYEIDIG